MRGLDVLQCVAESRKHPAGIVRCRWYSLDDPLDGSLCGCVVAPQIVAGEAGEAALPDLLRFTESGSGVVQHLRHEWQRAVRKCSRTPIQGRNNFKTNPVARV